MVFDKLKMAALGLIGAMAAMVGTASATLINTTEIVGDIDALGTILSALVGLIQTVIVNNIGVFIIVIILMVLIYIIKRFGWSFAEFFEGLLGGLFHEGKGK